MKRLIDWRLATWKLGKKRKPLLLKRARQIGKTYSVRQFGKQFESFVEINFELVPKAKTIFEMAPLSIVTQAHRRPIDAIFAL
jgi:uncharacterized protein